MSNSWQASLQDENDTPKITFYNPQQFQQQGIPQHGLSQQQSANQVAMQPSSQPPGFSHSQASYHYPTQYEPRQESAGQYNNISQNQELNWSQPGIQHYEQNYPYNAAVSGPPVSFGNNYVSNPPVQSVPPSETTFGQYTQMHQYQDPSNLIPDVGTNEDEPITSQGDWNDIDLGRDPDEYESSSSSEYGGDAVDHQLTGYMEGFEASRMPFYTNQTSVEGFQHPFISASDVVAQSSIDRVDSNVPVNSNVPPPQPLPESLMCNTIQTTHQPSHVPMHPSGWFAPQSSADDISSVENIANAVDNLNIFGTQQSPSGTHVATSNEHVGFESRNQVRQTEPTMTYHNPESKATSQELANRFSNESTDVHQTSDRASELVGNLVQETDRTQDTLQSEQVYPRMSNSLSESSSHGLQLVDTAGLPLQTTPSQMAHETSGNSQKYVSQMQGQNPQSSKFHESHDVPTPGFVNQSETFVSPPHSNPSNTQSHHGLDTVDGTVKDRDVGHKQGKPSLDELYASRNISDDSCHDTNYTSASSKAPDQDNPYQPRNSVHDDVDRNFHPQSSEQVTVTNNEEVSRSSENDPNNLTKVGHLDPNPVAPDTIISSQSLDASSQPRLIPYSSPMQTTEATYPVTTLSHLPQSTSTSKLRQISAQPIPTGNILNEMQHQQSVSHPATSMDIQSEAFGTQNANQSFHVVSKQPTFERADISELDSSRIEGGSEIPQRKVVSSQQEEDEKLQLQLRQLELEELEIERRKKLLSLQLEEQELKARKRELLQRKQGLTERSSANQIGIEESQAQTDERQTIRRESERLQKSLILSNEADVPGNQFTLGDTSGESVKVQAQQPMPIQDQPKKQLHRSDLTQQQQRKSGRTPVVGNIKPSEELRQIMSNMRPSPKKPPSVSSARVPSRQSSVMSDKNSVDNHSDLLSASRAGDYSLSQYQVLRQFGMPVDPYYGAAYQESSSRAGSEYGATLDRSPSRGSATSYEPWQQMYMQQQQAWYHHYHHNKRGDTGYGGWSFANGWPSFEQWYHAMYMQQNQAYYQWWEQYYSGGSFSASHGDTGYPNYPGYPGYPHFDPTAGWASADQHDLNSLDRTGRRTPRRYLTAHCAVSLSLAGVIIQVSPNRPDEGEPARVQLLQMPLIDKDESKYVVFPGPLQRSETIPSDVRAFLRTKCEDIQRRLPSDLESAYLLIAYLELLIKNRGTVLGIDVVDLLLEGHTPKTTDIRASGPLVRATSYESLVSLPPSGRSTPLSGMSNSGVPICMKEAVTNSVMVSASQDKSLDDFRKLLLCGRRRQALHYACKHSLWGHALYLAQEMGPDILENTRSRFSKEAIHPHDPIQTYYQFCGRLIPEVSTNYSSVNGNWGDWRPHLAMLVANQEENPDLAARAIIQLGDSLAAQQLLFASQLCYLLAGCEFGRLENKNAKISMISVDHRRIQSVKLISDEAIQLTEVFEYAMTLAHRDFCIPSLQLYKFIYATRLLDAGLVEESFKYFSVIGCHLIRTPHLFPGALADSILQLSDRLQYHPACVHEYSRDWIEQLRSIRHYGQFGNALDKDNAILRENETIRSAADQTDLNPDLRQNNYQQSIHGSEAATIQQQHHLNPQNPQMQQQQSEKMQQLPSAHPEKPYMNQPTQYYQVPQQQTSHEDGLHSGHPQRMYQESATQNLHQGHPQNQVSGAEYSTSHSITHSSGGERPPSTSYQHHDVVSHTIHEQAMNANTVNESPGPAEAIPYFNPAVGHPGGQTSTMQFYNPSNKHAVSDSLPPSPSSPGVQGGEAFDYFSNVNQFVQPGRKRTVSGSSSSGGPSSPSASISLGQGAFKTYSRHSPTRSRTTSVASSGGQRSRHSSTADHPNMPPPSRPAPRKGTAPVEQQQQQQQQQPTTQQGSDGLMQDQSSSEPGNQKGVWKKLVGLFRPQNEVHLPDDKKPTIVWDPQKNEWVNQSGPEESSVVTAPPKLSQIPNPGEIRYRSGGIGGRGAAGRYVDVLASSKSSSSTSAGAAQAPPMLPPPPGQTMMGSVAAPGPMPMPPLPPNRAPGAPPPQFFVPGPPPAQPMPQ